MAQVAVAFVDTAFVCDCGWRREGTGPRPGTIERGVAWTYDDYLVTKAHRCKSGTPVTPRSRVANRWGFVQSHVAFLLA